jgi:hypothetical protein
MAVNLLSKGLEKAHRGFVVAVNAKMGQHEGSEQPAPDRSLVIDGVALPVASAIMPLICLPTEYGRCPDSTGTIPMCCM